MITSSPQGKEYELQKRKCSEKKGKYSEKDEKYTSQEIESHDEQENYQWLLHVKAYFEFIIDEWNAGEP